MPVARPSLTPADAAAFASQRLRRNVGMAFCFIAILLLINWNAKNLSTPSTGLGIGNSKAQASISRKGFVRLPSGATVRTASADQGDNQCISSSLQTRRQHSVRRSVASSSGNSTVCGASVGRARFPKAARLSRRRQRMPPLSTSIPFPPPPPPEAASFTHDDRIIAPGLPVVG